MGHRIARFPFRDAGCTRPKYLFKKSITQETRTKWKSRINCWQCLLTELQR